MSFRRWIAAVFVFTASTLPLAAAAEAPASSTPRRVELPGAPDKPFPYTVELPAGWELREIKELPGVWLGPADAKPPSDPRLVYVRISPTSLADPAQAIANIRAQDEKQPWSAPVLEAREVGGVRGVLVRMDSGEGEKARSTLVLKLPLEGGSVDFMGSASRAEFEKLRPVYEKVFFSVRPGSREARMPLVPFEGRLPRLGARAWVAPGAYVTGDVELGEDVSFWFHTVARGDVNWIRIGARTNIQDGSVLHVQHETHPLRIGAGVVVGHQAVVHGCTIEDGALIGIGARVLDGAVVEAGAQIGAGAVVAPGHRIPAGHLALGIPARVVRPLTEDETRRIADTCARYVALKEKYRGVVPQD